MGRAGRRSAFPLPKIKAPVVASAILAFLFASSSNAFQSAFVAGLNALNRNDLDTAQTQLEAASKLEPRRAEVWLALAQTYLKQHKTDAADASAAKAEHFGPENPVVLRGLALYFSERGSLDKAADLEARYASKANDAAAFAQAATLYAKAGKTQAAVPLFRKAIDRQPYDESYYFQLGQTLLQAQKFDAALETFQAGVRIFDKSAQLELARGVALYGLRRFPEAIDSFLRTIQLAPDVRQPYVFLGRMLDVAEAKLPAITQVFAAYAKSQPDDALANFLYAKALGAKSVDVTQIEALLRKSISLDDSKWESHFELGALLERKREYAESAKEFERSIELDPKEPMPHYRLARVYDRLGKGAEAEQQRVIHARLSGQNKAEREAVK
jgi:tetratricopeptide (TPR) repeat protein